MSGGLMGRRIAFVSPRFGAEIVGGAELLLREIALGLVDRGWEVQVLTTCAVSPYTWANELTESARVEEGVLVRRFQNVLATSASKEHAVHGRIYYGERPSLDDQVTWLNALFRNPGPVRGPAPGNGRISTFSFSLPTCSGTPPSACP